MKAQIIAWNGPYKEYKDNDIGFKTLNDYQYGPIREIEESTLSIAIEMEEEFKTMYPDFEHNHMQLIIYNDHGEIDS